MALPDHNQLTEAEYLTFEDDADTKHEYAAGQVIAMTGASWAHNVIGVNVSSQLHSQLIGKTCTVTANDLRLKVEAEVSYRYPDVMAVCGEPSFIKGRTDTITNPTLIVEILSKTTAFIDHNTKLDEYTQIPTLQAYLLIDQTQAKLIRYLRQGAQDWLYTAFTGLDAHVQLPFIGCELRLADVYENITLNGDSTP